MITSHRPIFQKTILALGVATGLTFLAGSANASTVLTNTGASSWWQDGWGRGSTLTIGSVFQAPSNGDNVLNTIGLYFKYNWGSQTFAYQGSIYQWDDTNGKTVGSPLFSQNYIRNIQPNTPTLLEINAGAVSLNSGTKYAVIYTTTDPTSVAYNNTSGDFDLLLQWTNTSLSNGSGQAIWSWTPSYSSTFGSSWFTQDGNYGGRNIGSYNIMSATFSNTVPEPSAYALFGMGAIGMLTMWRRKSA